MKIELLIKITGWITGLVFIGFVLALVFSGYQYSLTNLDSSITGQIGDFFGGVIGSLLSFLSILYLVQNLNLQRESIGIQTQTIIQSQINDFKEFYKLTIENFNIELNSLLSDSNFRKEFCQDIGVIVNHSFESEENHKKALDFFSLNQSKVLDVLQLVLKTNFILFSKIDNFIFLEIKMKKFLYQTMHTDSLNDFKELFDVLKKGDLFSELIVKYEYSEKLSVLEYILGKYKETYNQTFLRLDTRLDV